MRAKVPRHSWEATGLVTTGPLGGVAAWHRCRWCGQHDTRDRRQQLHACVGAPRLEPVRPRGWWRREAEARGPQLPPEPTTGFPRFVPLARLRIDDRA